VTVTQDVIFPGPYKESSQKLKRVRTLPTVKLVGRVPGDPHEALVGYAEYYRAVHGEAIEVCLVVHVLQTFVDDDRAFQAWRRHTNGAGGAAAEPGNGTLSESRGA